MAGSDSLDVAKQVQDGLKSQGGTTNASGTDFKVDSSTKQGGGPDLSGYGGKK